MAYADFDSLEKAFEKEVSHFMFNWVKQGFVLCCKNALQQVYIDDVTNVYLQQTEGIGLSIHLNELLHILYGSLQGFCNKAGVLKAHALTNAMRAQTAGQKNNEYD